MTREHKYHKVRTIGDMKRAIADAEALGYTEETLITHQCILAPTPGTYGFSQPVEKLNPPTPKEDSSP